MYNADWDFYVWDEGVYVSEGVVRYVTHLRDVYGNAVEYHEIIKL